MPTKNNDGGSTIEDDDGKNKNVSDLSSSKQKDSASPTRRSVRPRKTRLTAGGSMQLVDSKSDGDKEEEEEEEDEEKDPDYEDGKNEEEEEEEEIVVPESDSELAPSRKFARRQFGANSIYDHDEDAVFSDGGLEGMVDDDTCGLYQGWNVNNKNKRKKE